MHHVFEIETSQFKGIAPRPDAVNELIGGDEMAAWLHQELAKRGVELSEIWADDHGWDFHAKFGGKPYLVVCSCDFENTEVPVTWHAVQVAHLRTWLDRLLGRNKPLSPDPLLEVSTSILRSNPSFVILADKEI